MRKFHAKDFSYRSHDGFTELPSGILESKDNSSTYASQQKVFNDLGRDVIKNALDGKIHNSAQWQHILLYCSLQALIVHYLHTVKRAQAKVIPWLVTV